MFKTFQSLIFTFMYLSLSLSLKSGENGETTLTLEKRKKSFLFIKKWNENECWWQRKITRNYEFFPCSQRKKERKKERKKDAFYLQGNIYNTQNRVTYRNSSTVMFMSREKFTQRNSSNNINFIISF